MLLLPVAWDRPAARVTTPMAAGAGAGGGVSVISRAICPLAQPPAGGADAQGTMQPRPRSSSSTHCTHWPVVGAHHKHNCQGKVPALDWHWCIMVYHPTCGPAGRTTCSTQMHARMHACPGSTSTWGCLHAAAAASGARPRARRALACRPPPPPPGRRRPAGRPARPRPQASPQSPGTPEWSEGTS